jgi:hypothetical protein
MVPNLGGGGGVVWEYTGSRNPWLGTTPVGPAQAGFGDVFFGFVTVGIDETRSPDLGFLAAP